MLQDSFLSPRPTWLPRALDALARHEFLTARQVAALVGEPLDALTGVFDALVTEGLLRRLLPTPTLTGPMPAPAFALTRQGATLLRAALEGPHVRVPRRAKSLFTLAHDLRRNELGVVLELLHREGALRLHRFEVARAKLADSVLVFLRGRLQRIPLVADAYVVLQGHDGPTALLVEIDMGTVSLQRMREKYTGYMRWHRECGALRRFGLQSLRVLTIAPTERRAEHLREAALVATNGGSGLFWFGTHAQVDVVRPHLLLDSAWSIGTHDAAPGHLLAAPISAPRAGAS